MSSDHAADPVSHDHAVDIDRQVRIYITVFVALMALTVVTVAISYLHLRPAMAVVVAMLVATVKGSLVAAYFMHLVAEKRLILLVLLITGVTFIALLVLPVFTHGGGFWIEP
jgi:cytochrome c oxidase subunit 4